MNEAHWLTKAELKRGLPIAQLLQPAGDQRNGASHNLVWCLFGDHADRKRDFLYREMSPGQFYLLSKRRPEDPHGLFDLWPSRAFTPNLAIGDVLQFTLSVNATRTIREDDPEKGPRKGKRRHHDVVMHLKSHMGKDLDRRTLEHRSGLSWFADQGSKHGFTFQWDEDPKKQSEVNVLGYETRFFSKNGRTRNAMKLGVLELAGSITITDPAAFLPRLLEGFGRAKGFGCGLMLIRKITRGNER